MLIFAFDFFNIKLFYVLITVWTVMSTRLSQVIWWKFSYHVRNAWRWCGWSSERIFSYRRFPGEPRESDFYQKTFFLSFSVFKSPKKTFFSRVMGFYIMNLGRKYGNASISPTLIIILRGYPSWIEDQTEMFTINFSFFFI